MGGWLSSTWMVVLGVLLGLLGGSLAARQLFGDNPDPFHITQGGGTLTPQQQTVATAALRNSDAEVLWDLYEGCGGPQWFSHTRWGVGDPCFYRWFGVECRDGHVSGLLLSANNLRCSFPCPIQHLSSLEVLDLRGNGLLGPLPPWLGTFSSKLRKVDVSANRITGALPSMPQGVELSAEGNRLNAGTIDGDSGAWPGGCPGGSPPQSSPPPSSDVSLPFTLPS